MFTLTKASKETKIIIKIFGIIIAIVLIIALLARLWMYFFPAPKPKPTVTFGKITSMNFPETEKSQDFTYTVNTLSGFLPTFTDQVNVYPIVKYKPELLALNNTRDLVNNNGFLSGPIKISDNLYNWSNNSSNLKKTLQVNIINHNFTLTSNFYLDEKIKSVDSPPNQIDAQNLATEFLQNMEALPDDIDSSKTQETILSINNNLLVLASSISNTQLIRVNFLQSDVDNLPIYYEKPNESNINVLIGGSMDNLEVIEATYIHQEIENQSSTYPIKTANQAFDELKNGKAFIASYYGNNKTVKIRNVYLGYYIGRIEQDYLMPIFVFEGDDGFIAYVNAVTDEWIEN